MSRKVAIIGAGPVGLEAAIYARTCGYDVDVFERGLIAKNILLWGHVSLFSPWEMNHSSLGVNLIKSNSPTWQEPVPSAMMTGREYVEQYLQPLSEIPLLENCIHTHSEIISVGKSGVLKGDLVGSSERKQFPFRLLVKDADGFEKLHTADIVIDASGVYCCHNWMGNGGVPALGELSLQKQIDYLLCDIYGKDRARFAGKRTLLVGGGYSAATTVCAFQNLIREEPGTSLLWVTRGNRAKPIIEIEDDPLVSRAQLTSQANEAYTSTNITLLQNTVVEKIGFDANNETYEVSLLSGDDKKIMIVDRIIANVGYGPDNSIYRELQMHECWASRGPMKLAAALLGASSADCMDQQSMGADTLKNPEPDFYIIGNKSYGRNPTFLLRIGLEQIVEVFSLITNNSKLNLYATSTERAGIV